VLRYLRHVTAADPVGDWTDESLLDRFVGRGEETAFAALVRRHGPMVLGVCRRILRDPHDADDAFQATFLVLVWRAHSLGRDVLLGPWLYGVAYRTALHARGERARRRARELQAEVTAMAEPAADTVWRDLRPVLDEEVQRLPEKYRIPFVLCYLEGKTYEEAAALLGCPKGTVATRLARARQRLQTRLLGRGLALSGAALAVAVAEGASAAVPAALMGTTVEAAVLTAAGKAATPRAATLAEGVLKAMTLRKLSLAVGLACVVGFLAADTGVLTYRAVAAERPAPENAPQPPPGEPARKGDRDLLQGTWKVVAADANGKHQPRDVSDTQRWVIAGGTITVRYDDGESEELTYRLNEDSRPREIDLAVTAGPFKGSKYKGIYELDGDRLKVRYTRNQLPDAARPTTFDAGAPEFSEDRGARFHALRREEEDKGDGKPEARKDEGPFLKKYQVKGVDIEAGFVPYKTEVVQGEPLTATFRVKDLSAKPFTFDFGGDYRGTGRHDRFKITATDARGRPLRDPKADANGNVLDMGGIQWNRVVKPGEATTEEVDLAKFRAFDGPGEYDVTCRFDLGAVVETTYRLTILPRTDANVRRVIRELVGQAGKDRDKALARTVGILTTFAGEQAVPDLAALARDGDAEHRAAALAGLGRFTTREAEAAALRALRDPDEPVRAAAAAALGGIKTDAAVDGLIARLPKETPAGTAALLVALGRTQSPKGLPHLVRALDHADAGVRQAAVEGLKENGSPEAIAALKRCATGDDLDRREAAVRALVESLKQPLQLEWIFPVVRAGKDYTSSGGHNPSEGLRLLRLYGGEHKVAAMVSCLDFDNPSPRPFLSTVVFYEPDVTREFPNLHWHHDPNSDGTPEQLEANRRVLRELRDWLADYERDHGPIAPPVAGPAGRVKPELAAKIDGLVRRLGSDKYAEREAAGKDLEAIGAPALNALRKAATTDENTEVRRRAVDVFKRIRRHE
jgi:RNA polymerase sigma factor (sigma-70 family)